MSEIPVGVNPATAAQRDWKAEVDRLRADLADARDLLAAAYAVIEDMTDPTGEVRDRLRAILSAGGGDPTGGGGDE